MFHYSAFRLRVSSNRELPQLPPCGYGQGADSVEVTFGPFPPGLVDAWQAPSGTRYLSERYSGGEKPQLTVRAIDGNFFCFHYAIGVALICRPDTLQVWGQWRAPATLEDARLAFLGPVLG